MTEVVLGSSIRRTVGLESVSLRSLWAADWAFYDQIQCREITWSLSPTMPTATLEYHYGFLKREWESTYSLYPKLEPLGWYVKVVVTPDIEMPGATRTWWGVIGHVEDEQWGTTRNGLVSAPSGVQVLHCYGLEKLLDSDYLSESYVDNGSFSPIVVQLPVTFNRDGIPNRNDRLMSPQNQYVFEGQSLWPGETLRPTAQWWSSKDIIDYLLAWPLPGDSFRTRNKRVPFELVDAGNLIATNDRPVLRQEGQTILSAVNRLVDRRRLRSFRTIVDDSQTPNVVQVVPVAWNSELIDPDLDDVDPLNPNTDIVSLLCDYSQAARPVVRTTAVNKYNRVVVRGARRTTTATFYVDPESLDIAWSAEQEAEYEEGASSAPGYAGCDIIDQIRMNAEARSKDSLAAVYSWFKLPDTWQQKIKIFDTGSTFDAFIDDDSNRVEQYIHEIVFEQQLPLYEQVDYRTNEDLDEPPVRTYRQPFVVFVVAPVAETGWGGWSGESSTEGRWVDGSKIATLQEGTWDAEKEGTNLRWSALCRVQPEKRTIEIRVSGEPQHVIAHGDFSPLEVDRELGEYDYRNAKMLVTLAVRDNRYCEGKYPADGTLDSGQLDMQYGYVIYAGDAYRQDRLISNTVVDVDIDGSLMRAAGGYIRDDTKLLNLLARIAYEWWSQERVVLTLTSTDIPGSLDVGAYIDTLGDADDPESTNYQEVNTVISELRITWPKLRPNELDAPVMTLVTGAGELDPMTLAPPPPAKNERVNKARSRR